MSDRYGSIAIEPDSPAAPSRDTSKPAPHRPKQKKQTSKSNSKPLFISLIIFFLVSTYFLVAIYLIPLAIQKYLPQYVRNQTGIELSINSVELNPFNFQLTFEKINADTPLSSTPGSLLQINSLFIDLDFTSLIRNSLTCDTLVIDALELNLIRYKDKSYNLPILSFFSGTRQHGQIIDFASLPFLFSLNNIAINNSEIFFEDQVTNKTHEIEELQLAIPTLSNFSFQSKNYITPHFSAVINGSPIQLSGEAVQLDNNQGFQTKLSCSIQSLNLVPYFSYLPAAFPLTMTRGQADTSLEISFAPNKEQGDRLRIDIKMNATDLEFGGKSETLQISVPSLSLDAVITPMEKRFHIKDIITKKMQISSTRELSASALHTVFFPGRDTGKNNGTGKPLAISIDRFLTDQGTVIFHSTNSSGKDIRSQWNDLQISIKDFNPENSSGTIHISGDHGGDRGSFSWQGDVGKSGEIRGKLLLNDFSAATFVRQLSPDTSDTITGLADFSGDLSFHSTKHNQLSYSFDGAVLQFQHLQISQKKRTWFRADSVRFNRISSSDNILNLGDIFLKGAELSLDSTTLPPLFNRLLTEKGHPLIRGIDYSGTVQIRSGTTQEKPLQIRTVLFQANRLNSRATTENFVFSGVLPEKGIVKARGILNLSPTRIQAKIAFSDVTTKALTPFISDWPLLARSDTTLHGKGVYRFPEPSFQGDLRLSQTTLKDSSNTTLLSWKTAELNTVTCHFNPLSLQADSLFIDSPQLQWIRTERSPFQDIQRGIRSLFQKSSSEPDNLFPVEIKKTAFRNGTVDILDKRLFPVWSGTLTSLEGKAGRLDSTDTGLSPFSLKGSLGDSSLNFSGSVTLFNPKVEGHAGMTLSGFPLKSFSRQLETAPVDPVLAEIDLKMNMKETVSQFNSVSDIRIQNLHARSSNSSTAMALAFLQDKNNSFSMKVTIDLSSQSLLKQGVAAFQTTVIKASYAPLLLDRRFKDLQDKGFISFAPGSHKLNASARAILGRYAELLREHPGLGLLITGMADKKHDVAILKKEQEALERQRVDKINTIKRAEYRRKQQALAAVKPGNTIKEENIDKKELDDFTPVLPDPVQISNETLLELARQRSLIINDFFTHSLNIAPKHLSITSRVLQRENPAANGADIDIRTVVEKRHQDT